MANYQTNKKSQQGIYGKLKNRVFIYPFTKSHPLQQITDNDPIRSYGPSTGPFISSAPQETEKKSGASYNKKLMKIYTTGKKSAAKMDKRVENNHNDEKFSEYINRVKGGMRTESEIRVETFPTKTTRGVSRRDSLNDKVSNFLTRARIKIRTTSSVGDMKSTSSKEKEIITNN